MQRLYSNNTCREWKVIAVFVGGKQTPSSSDYLPLLTQDPDIVPGVLVITFEGLPDVGSGNDDDLVRSIVWQGAPGFLSDEYGYQCTRTGDLLLIKVFAEQKYLHTREDLLSDKDVRKLFSEN